MLKVSDSDALREGMPVVAILVLFIHLKKWTRTLDKAAGIHCNKPSFEFVI